MYAYLTEGASPSDRDKFDAVLEEEPDREEERRQRRNIAATFGDLG